MAKKKSVMVIDHEKNKCFVYKLPLKLDSEETEDILISKGHSMSNCSWGEFDGNIKFR